MKIVGFMLGTLVMALSASSIGIIPALIIGAIVGGVLNTLFFSDKPKEAQASTTTAAAPARVG